jgi:hypothetical protein
MKAAIIAGCVALLVLSVSTAHAEPVSPPADILAAVHKRFPNAEISWWTDTAVNFFDGQWHRTCNLRLKPKPIKIYRCGIVHA